MRGSRWAALLARVLRPGMIRHHRRNGDQFRGRAVLYLTTVGARTGTERQSAVGYEPDGEGAWLVVASFGGAAHHPGWYHNIAAHPDRVWIEVGGRRHRVQPEQLEGQRRAGGRGQIIASPPSLGGAQGKNDPGRPGLRRAEAWAQIIASRPSMAGYQEKTDRVLPVLRLTGMR